MAPIKRVETGGDVSLSGFRELDPGELSAAEKIISHYEQRFCALCGEGMRMKITMKKVHATPKSQKFEFKAFVEAQGKRFDSTVTERNLFIGLDAALKKIENEISK